MADEAKAKNKTGGTDILSVLGLLVALCGILGGLILEGGKLRDVAQVTAAIIVLGGTAGAVMLSTPGPVLKGGLRRMAGVFHDPAPPIEELIDELVRFATKARKTGLVSLEQDGDDASDPFLKKAMTLAVDGTDLQEIRAMLDLEIALTEHQAEAEAKVFESAGGYAPTIGIIGAVLGLIQVMKNLANIDEVGHGIAVAFVATVYGVGVANLILLPIGSKIKARARAETRRRELIVEGVSGIVEGLNPKLVRIKLQAYALEAPQKHKGKAPASVAAREPVEA
jgi:chemotaxis protein MotA